MLMTDLVLFIFGMVSNLAASLIITRGIYYPKRRSQDYIFTFVAFSVVIYLVMGLFSSVELSIGVGFGLFALFSVLRYRTETVPIREMTYLFVMVALPIMNSILYNSDQYTELALSDLMIIAVLWFLEMQWGFQYDLKKLVHYEKTSLIRADLRDELIADLRERTGLPITSVEIVEIDFLRDSADLMITYRERSSLPVPFRKTPGQDIPPSEFQVVPDISSPVQGH
jgi:hypothetical protein